MKHFKKIMLFAAAALLFTACGPDEPEVTGSEEKAKIENLAVTPATNLKYGDVVTLSATLSDTKGLRSYDIKISNAAGELYQKTQMLTGLTFSLNENVVIPLPKNAVAGDLKLELTVKNSGNKLATEEKTFANVTVPVFDKLFLEINGTFYPMTKNGSVFDFENFFPAEATGKIYADAAKNGIFWGMDGSEIKALADNNILVGKEAEAYFKLSFNPVSFDLTKGDEQIWQAASGNDLYIFGNISGHWQDGGDNEVSAEKAKMKMVEYVLGNRRMWTWFPPSVEGTDDPEVTCYGATVAGTFRFKKGGVAEYVTYNAGKITTGADNKGNSFILSAPGAFHFRVMGDANGITSVKVFDDNQAKSLEYKNGEVLLNGVPAVPSVTFAGQALSLTQGNYFVYESATNVTLAQNASVTGQGIDLAKLYADPDVFNGSGNNVWQVKQEGEFYIRIDAFSGHVYLREERGYPAAIYLDGWCWKKYPNDPRSNWFGSTGVNLSASLYKVGTSNVYEASIYIQPWGGDFKVFATPGLTQVMKSKYFENITPMDESGFKFPIPSAPGGYYKISVDLKDGFTWNTEILDGENYTLVPTNGKKFTLTFTPL